MAITILLIASLLVLAAICAKGYYSFKAQKEEDEQKIQAIPVDFKVDFLCKKGWFGKFYDKNGVDYYGHIVNLPADASVKGCTLRVLSEGLVDGNYVLKAIDLSKLPADTVVTTYQDGDGEWHCMYPGPQGIAFAGKILNSSKLPLKPDQQWRAIKQNANEFSLV